MRADAVLLLVNPVLSFVPGEFHDALRNGECVYTVALLSSESKRAKDAKARLPGNEVYVKGGGQECPQVPQVRVRSVDANLG